MSGDALDSYGVPLFMVAWRRRHGRLSREHYTYDYKKTLCGVEIPTNNYVGAYAGGDYCLKCFKDGEVTQ